MVTNLSSRQNWDRLLLTHDPNLEAHYKKGWITENIHMVWYLVVNDNRIQHNAIMQKNTKTNKKTSCALRFLDGSICDDQVAAVTMSVIVQFLLNMTSLVF